MAKKPAKKGAERPTKISKSGVKEKTYMFFNKLDFKSMNPDDLIKRVQDMAADTLLEYNKGVDPWCTFVNLEAQVVKTWDTEDVFIRFWLDRLIEDYGYMIWNVVYKKYYKEDWYIHGTLVEVPELPAKLRQNPEAIAGYFADLAMIKFKDNFL